MYAWFSEKQAELTGIVVYEAADGSQVECTEVAPKEGFVSRWADAEYRGEVRSYVTRRTEGARVHKELHKKVPDSRFF